jgi:hypothetical protein
MLGDGRPDWGGYKRRELGDRMVQYHKTRRSIWEIPFACKEGIMSFWRSVFIPFFPIMTFSFHETVPVSKPASPGSQYWVG